MRRCLLLAPLLSVAVASASLGFGATNFTSVMAPQAPNRGSGIARRFVTLSCEPEEHLGHAGKSHVARIFNPTIIRGYGPRSPRTSSLLHSSTGLNYSSLRWHMPTLSVHALGATNISVSGFPVQRGVRATNMVPPFGHRYTSPSPKISETTSASSPSDSSATPPAHSDIIVVESTPALHPASHPSTQNPRDRGLNEFQAQEAQLARYRDRPIQERRKRALFDLERVKFQIVFVLWPSLIGITMAM